MFLLSIIVFEIINKLTIVHETGYTPTEDRAFLFILDFLSSAISYYCMHNSLVRGGCYEKDCVCGFDTVLGDEFIL
jgi:hypothetical protein